MAKAKYAPRNSVSVESCNGSLRLRLPRVVYGKVRYISVGLSDTPTNWLIAEQKAREAEYDIQYNEFDSTHEKYKHKPHLRIVREDEKPKEFLIKDIWHEYYEYKKTKWEVSTLENQAAQATRHINALPIQSLDDPAAIRDYLLKDLSEDTVRRLLMQINAACKWKLGYKWIRDNPFDSVIKGLSKSKRDSDEEPDPFTEEEMNGIISAFRKNKFSRYKTKDGYSHSSYYTYIKFLFLTGCRPSEAAALRWEDVHDKYVHFHKAVVRAGKQRLVEKEGLKTQKQRKFLIDDQMRKFFDSIKPEVFEPGDLVFTIRGRHLNKDAFRNVFYRVLKELEIRKRKPYTTRHTYITLQVQAGTPIAHIARQTGTSASVIERHYLGGIGFMRRAPMPIAEDD